MPSVAKKILIVEDEPFVAEVVQCALEDGHEVLWAADVSGALTCLRDARPDMMLVDCVIPGGNLSDLLDKAGVCGLPVVMMSGHSDMLGQLTAFGYPCLRKPFEFAVLLEMVELVLNGGWRLRARLREAGDGQAAS